MAIQAIPLTYGGTRFRSSLEANWAATLDALRMAWAYEPIHVTLPSGERYLPDFHLRDLGTWIEVKGDGIPRAEKAREFAQTRACHCTTDCACQWPGGEIVLLGRPSRRPVTNKRMRFGALAWDDALGGTATLGRCAACRAWSWCRPRDSAACRACRRRHTGHLHGSGEIDFRISYGGGELDLGDLFGRFDD